LRLNFWGILGVPWGILGVGGIFKGFEKRKNSWGPTREVGGIGFSTWGMNPIPVGARFLRVLPGRGVRLKKWEGV